MDKDDLLHLLHFNFSPFDDINERYSPRTKINERIGRNCSKISKSSDDSSFLERFYLSKKFPKDDLDEQDDELLYILKQKPKIQNENANLLVRYEDKIELEDFDNDSDDEVSFNLSRINRKKLKKSQSELIFHREKPRLSGRV